MRFFHLLKGELRFCVKYGLLFLYLIVTVCYIVLLRAIPQGAREITGAVLIFTDPAAMGLFFMGAMMLLEKSQGVNYSLFVSPVRTAEYITAKVLALLLFGTAVGVVLSITISMNPVAAIVAVMLSSFLFTLCAIIAAVKTHSLNSFMLAVVPVELIISVPAILYLFQVLKADFWIIHPGVAAMVMLMDKQNLFLTGIISLCLWNAVVFLVCGRVVDSYFSKMGGGKG